jgi:hypothetical protein
MTYRGDWDSLPDLEETNAAFARERMEAGDVSWMKEVFSEPSSIELTEAQKIEHVFVHFSGDLEVPADDVYVFALASDDGSDLWIDGERVIDNGGLHGTVEKRGHVPLAAGKHAIRVRWFNKTGGAALALRWAPLGEELRPVGPFTHPRGM